MTSVDRVLELCEQHKIPVSHLEKRLGFANAYIKRLKKPLPYDRAQAIADFFDVSVDYILTGDHNEKKSDSGKSYYFSDETAKAAQELFENKDLRALMSAARDVSPEAIQAAATLLKAWKETNPDG